jgi:hypothetical protein
MRSASMLTGLLFAGLLVTVGLSQPARSQEAIKLPAPEMSGGMPLMDALTKRRSTRLFGDQGLSPQQLSNLLWAAFGINRPESGGRTAPSWRGSNEIDIYVAMPDGVRIYDVKANELRPFMSGDIRSRNGQRSVRSQCTGRIDLCGGPNADGKGLRRRACSECACRCRHHRAERLSICSIRRSWNRHPR